MDGPLGVLVRSPGLRRLWAAQAISLIGDWFHQVALPVLVSSLSGGSGRAIGMVLVLECLPLVLVGPFSGVLVDRFDRRRLLVATDLLRALVVPLFLLAIHLRSLPLAFALAFVHFSISSAFEPGRSAFLPSLVRPQDLVAAATLGSVTWSACIALGGILAGTLVSGFGLPSAFLLDSATFLVSALLILSIRPAHITPPPAPERPAAERTLLEGLRYARSHPATAAALLIKTSNGLAVLDVYMAIYATRLFASGEGGAASMGLFYSSFGVGAVAGPLLLNLLNDGSVRRMRRLVLVGCALMTSGLLVFFLAPDLRTACLGVLLRGMGGSANWTYSTVILQKTVPDELRGRLFSLDMGAAHLMAALMVGTSGFLVDLAGVRAAVLTSAGLTILPLVAWAAALPWIERQDPEPELR